MSESKKHTFDQMEKKNRTDHNSSKLVAPKYRSELGDFGGKNHQIALLFRLWTFFSYSLVRRLTFVTDVEYSTDSLSLSLTYFFVIDVANIVNVCVSYAALVCGYFSRGKFVFMILICAGVLRSFSGLFHIYSSHIGCCM